TNTDGQTSAVPGSAITYTIVVTNAGPSSVTGASVTDTLPATLTGATYTATATGGATGYAASGTITYVVKATISSSATGTLSNTATVGAPAGVTDPNTTNNSATDSDTLSGGTTSTDLQITMTDGKTTVVPGSVVTYTIVVTNAGPNAVTGANIVDTLPAAFSNVSFTATATGGAS